MAEVFVVKAPGKALLMGEYAVLDGSPAVVAAVGCFAKASWEQAPVGPTKSPFVLAASRVVAEAIQPAGKHLPLGQPYVHSAAFFQDRRKLGLGSSAAVTVATVGLLLEKAGFFIRDHLSWVHDLALQAHQEAQGIQGSGADIIASTWGGVRVLHAPAVETPLPAHVCLVTTSQSMSTASILKIFYGLRVRVKLVVQRLADAAQAFVLAWQQAEQTRLFAAVEAAADGYRALSGLLGIQLMTPDQEQIALHARAEGGVAKPSGAGGGDIAAVFLPNADAQRSFAARLPTHLAVLPYGVTQIPGVRYIRPLASGRM